MELTNRSRLIGAIFAFAALLGATPQDSISTSMYLRMSSLHDAAPVQGLSYDAIATVPRSPNIPASLLPADGVIGSIIMPVGTTIVAPEKSDFRNVSGFTVVQTDTDGTVVKRTTFTGISVQSIDLVGNGSGNVVRRIRFMANSVNVSPR